MIPQHSWYISSRSDQGRQAAGTKAPQEGPHAASPRDISRRQSPLASHVQRSRKTQNQRKLKGWEGISTHSEASTILILKLDKDVAKASHRHPPENKWNYASLITKTSPFTDKDVCLCTYKLDACLRIIHSQECKMPTPLSPYSTPQTFHCSTPTARTWVWRQNPK